MFAHDFLEEAAQHNALLQVHPYTKLLLGIGSIILDLFTPNYIVQIGRASCRERVYDDV